MGFEGKKMKETKIAKENVGNIEISRRGIELKDKNLEYHKELKLREEEVIDVLEKLLKKFQGDEK